MPPRKTAAFGEGLLHHAGPWPGSDQVRRIPVFVVVPPRLLLLDIAGPLEVLRQANRVQSSVRFEVRYIGPTSSLRTSIGITVAGIEPLPPFCHRSPGLCLQVMSST
jgi:transcriptional regulator GlxA family with amidase domain